MVLGKTGVNFAAGMSGGIAYVYDPENSFADKCNTGIVELSPLTLRYYTMLCSLVSFLIFFIFSDQTEYTELDDEAFVKNIIQKHLNLTGSPVAKNILDSWAYAKLKFVKVLPTDFKKVLIASCRPSNKYPYNTLIIFYTNFIIICDTTKKG